MGVSSYFEFITTLFGWILYDNFWTVLADSGIVYIPFIIILFTHIVNSRKAGDDEGSAAIQSLKKAETDIVVAIVVLFLAAIPFTTVQLGQMQYVRPTLDCAVQDDIASGSPAVINGANTGTSYDPTLATLGNQTGRIPIWWGFVHALTKSVVAASIASVPCSADMAAVHMRLENDHFDDPRVAREVQDFINDCYMPAKSQFYRQDRSALTQAQRDSIDYIGSNYFLNTNGYYNKFYSTTARQSWPFNAARDGGYENDAPLGHPDCASWWNDAQAGIRTKVLNSIDQTTRDEYVYDPRNVIQAATPGTALTTVQREDVLLRKFVAIKNSQANISGWGNDLSVSYTSGVTEGFNGGQGNIVNSVAGATGKLLKEGAITLVAGIGAAMSAPGHLAAGVAAREGSTIFLSLLLMVFICVLPFLMVFSLYRLSTLMTLSLIFFAMHFFYVLWGIAFWVDNHLINAIMSGSSNASGIFTAWTNPMQTTIILWVQRFLYIVFPVLWVSGLGWIGVNAGGMMTGFNTQHSGTSGAFQGGPAATGAAGKAIKGA